MRLSRNCIRLPLPVTGFFSVAYLTSFLPFAPVYFSSGSDSCFYPSCRLCLPLCTSFPVIIFSPQRTLRRKLWFFVSSFSFRPIIHPPLHEKEHSQEIDFRLMNRRIREPYVRWCERRTPVVRNRSRLLDYAMCVGCNPNSICSAQDYLVGQASGRQILRERTCLSSKGLKNT